MTFFVTKNEEFKTFLAFILGNFVNTVLVRINNDIAYFVRGVETVANVLKRCAEVETAHRKAHAD